MIVQIIEYSLDEANNGIFIKQSSIIICKDFAVASRIRDGLVQQFKGRFEGIIKPQEVIE